MPSLASDRCSDHSGACGTCLDEKPASHSGANAAGTMAIPIFKMSDTTWAASVQAYANVVKPTGAPDWSLRFSFIAPVPKQWFLGDG